jgi:hypothetical protein
MPTLSSKQKKKEKQERTLNGYRFTGLRNVMCSDRRKMRDSFSDHLVAEANEKKKKKMNVTYIFYSSCFSE